MDIGALSTVMSQSNVQQSAGIAVISKLSRSSIAKTPGVCEQNVNKNSTSTKVTVTWKE